MACVICIMIRFKEADLHLFTSLWYDDAYTCFLDPLEIVAVAVSLNIFIDARHPKERSGEKEWLSPAPSLVLTVVLTLHLFIRSSSHNIGTVLN